MQRNGAHGFTLVEVMVVVAIVSVLATLATYGVRRYIQSSKSHEATNMIKDIKEGQELYRRETHRYLDVSGGNINAIYPTRGPGRWAAKIQWGGDGPGKDNWSRLNVRPDGPVYFSYASVAGGAGDAPPATGDVWGSDSTLEANWPAVTDVWYVVKAVGDLDENGKQSVYVSSSFSSEVWFDNEGE